jgi:hypothetical protein
MKIFIAVLVLLLAAPPAASQVQWSAEPVPDLRPVIRRRNVTYVTGELPGADVVFRVRFNPRIPFSGRVSIAAVETRSFAIDGIDFLPGSKTKVVVGAPTGKITSYDVATGMTLPDPIPDTDAIAMPPAPGGTWPSTVLSTPTHFYYVENQFGFGGTSSHRIIRKPFAGGPEEVVFGGVPFGMGNFEGLEILGGRLYTFSKDPGMADKRALISIGLGPGGLWDGMPPAVEIPLLWEAPGPPTDGSDELDFDAFSGAIFGTNIINGEVIAFHPVLGEISSPGAAHFIDGAQVAASVGNLSLLGAHVDGIRSDGHGLLIFAGKDGVIAVIDAVAVMGDGAYDSDITPLVVAPGVSFDDLTPILGP